jgi:hypothetical protein
LTSVNTPSPATTDRSGKPVARRGRKATGLTQVAGLPIGRWAVEVQISPRARNVVRAALNLGVVIVVLLAASMTVHG